MPKKSGKDYEILTQWIFDQILNDKRVKTIDVKHGIDLQGKTALHEIDVYWEFEIGGVTYKTIVQAKDWKTPVDQGKLIQFKGVLDDIPNQPRGIFITRKGYQRGSREFADKNGIVLYELREPTEKDQADWIKRIHLHIDMSTPSFEIAKILPDEEFNRQQKVQRIHFSLLDSSKLFDENGVEIDTLQFLFQSLVPEGLELPPTMVSCKFDKPTFVETGDPNVPRAKIKGFEVIISKKLTTFEHEFVAPDFVGYVLKDVLGGTEKTFLKK